MNDILCLTCKSVGFSMIVLVCFFNIFFSSFASVRPPSAPRPPGIPGKLARVVNCGRAGCNYAKHTAYSDTCRWIGHQGAFAEINLLILHVGISIFPIRGSISPALFMGCNVLVINFIREPSQRHSAYAECLSA